MTDILQPIKMETDKKQTKEMSYILKSSRTYRNKKLVMIKFY